MTDDLLIEEAAKAILDDAETPQFVRDEQVWEWARRDARAALAVFEKAHAPTDSEREALASHCWYTTRWADGLGGFNWKCSCGEHDWGTAADNPERYKRYETEHEASLEAVKHIAAGFRRSVVPQGEHECAGGAEKCRSIAQGKPSGSDRRALAEFIDKSLDGDCGYGVGEFLAGGILSFVSERQALHAAFSPQGKPSDAQAETRVAYWQDCGCEWRTKYCDENHTRSARVPLAVLRAAGVVGQEGGKSA